MFVPFHSVYCSPRRFKYQIASLTSHFPPGVSGVRTEPKKHLQCPSPHLSHFITGGCFFRLFMSSLLYLWVFLVEFLVSAEAVISEVACLPVRKTNSILESFPQGRFGVTEFWKSFLDLTPLCLFFFSLLILKCGRIKKVFKDDYFLPIDTENNHLVSIRLLLSGKFRGCRKSILSASAAVALIKRRHCRLFEGGIWIFVWK